ncbi:MAG: TetR/AcrR family transcriptional regulator [Candidatus Promineifilaceae bacterium]
MALDSEIKTSGRRKRRIAARKAQILKAAETVFSQKGYERATTREIAKAADVSEGTLYNYFGSKSDLLEAVAKSFAHDIVNEITNLEADNLADMMAELLAARLRSGRERRLLMLFLFEARLSPDVHRASIQKAVQQIIDAMEKRFSREIESGVMRPVDPAVAARTISATVMGFAALYEMGQYGQERNGISPQKWGEELTDLFLNGLQTAEDCSVEDEE